MLHVSDDVMCRAVAGRHAVHAGQQALQLLAILRVPAPNTETFSAYLHQIQRHTIGINYTNDITTQHFPI